MAKLYVVHNDGRLCPVTTVTKTNIHTRCFIHGSRVVKRDTPIFTTGGKKAIDSRFRSLVRVDI